MYLRLLLTRLSWAAQLNIRKILFACSPNTRTKFFENLIWNTQLRGKLGFILYWSSSLCESSILNNTLIQKRCLNDFEWTTSFHWKNLELLTVRPSVGKQRIGVLIFLPSFSLFRCLWSLSAGGYEWVSVDADTHIVTGPVTTQTPPRHRYPRSGKSCTIPWCNICASSSTTTSTWNTSTRMENRWVAFIIVFVLHTKSSSVLVWHDDAPLSNEKS